MVDVTFSVPDNPDEAPSVGVAVTEFDAETGGIFFTGNAFSDLLDYQFGSDFDWCHLSAALRLASAMDDSVRDVDLNVVWNVDGEALSAAAGEGTGAKPLKNEQFEGILLPMDALGVVRVSNPLVPGNEVSATEADSLAVMWDTSVSANLLTKGPSPSDDSVSASRAELTASSTTSGYWTGY